MSGYRPGRVDGKTRVGLYLPDELVRQLRVHAAETGSSQSEIVERALKNHLGGNLMENMGTWTTEKATVKEVDHNYDLHAFEVYNLDGVRLGIIFPATLEDMQDIIDALNDGDCPVGGAWEDGMGNTCSLDGWGAHSDK